MNAHDGVHTTQMASQEMELGDVTSAVVGVTTLLGKTTLLRGRRGLPSVASLVVVNNLLRCAEMRDVETLKKRRGFDF